ncbi:hypothetical protein FA95DRAFT_1020550 [Auriscalpium vulgare]|uniref:Uncharacterized protein n=1 Tax=Auriscalpium vulgare TaxID=40419 RepID=A0ACB8R7A9_9AGAM|nr:hypothetical protein FA95DRAFT_1020550 [Auriscalpium vulgare]
MNVLPSSGMRYSTAKDTVVHFRGRDQVQDDSSKEGKQAGALAAFASLGYQGLTVGDFEQLHNSDEYDTEMAVMAEVRSYFQVSYKRIIDTIPMAVDSIFVKGIPVALRVFLRERLNLNDKNASSRCTHYFAEEYETVARRHELLTQKTTLEAVKDVLDNFGFSTSHEIVLQPRP